MSKWTMQHENDSRIEVTAGVSLKLALASGYRWVNKNDGEGWQQVSILARSEAVRRAVGI